MFSRNTNDDEEANQYVNNEEYGYQNQVCSSRRRRRTRINRLTEGQIAHARSIRIQEMHMWSIIRRAFIYVSVFTVLCVLTYSNRNLNSFLQVHHLHRYFTNSRQMEANFMDVSFPLRHTLRLIFFDRFPRLMSIGCG